MKKKIIVVALITTFMSLCVIGCKSSEVRNAEQLISQIGTVTVDSWDEIEAAENALNSLSDSDYEHVNNKRQFEQAKEEFNNIIDVYNQRIESARASANQENTSTSTISMTKLSEGIEELTEIRAELPDEVVERYIVFNSDMSMDQWIEEMSDLITDSCYPGTTCMRFDVWYWSVTGSVVFEDPDESGSRDYYYKVVSGYSPDGIDYLWDVKYAYDDYVSSEGYGGSISCGLVGGEDIGITID